MFILKGATSAQLIEGPKNVGSIIKVTWPNMTSHTWKILLKSKLHVNTIFKKCYDPKNVTIYYYVNVYIKGFRV